MALSPSTMPTLVLSALAAAVFLFSTPSSCSCSCPSTIGNGVVSGSTVNDNSYDSAAFLRTIEEDVERVKDQIHVKGLHMCDNVLHKGINPHTRAQQLPDLTQLA